MKLDSQTYQLNKIEFVLDKGAQVSSTTEPMQFTDNILIQNKNMEEQKVNKQEKNSALK